MVPNHRHQIALRGLYGRWTIGESPSKKWWPTTIAKLKLIKVIIILSTIVNWIHFAPSKDSRNHHMAMDQYLLIPFLGGWTSIYQLFWCSPGVQGFDTLPYQNTIEYFCDFSVTSQISKHFAHKVGSARSSLGSSLGRGKSVRGLGSTVSTDIVWLSYPLELYTRPGKQPHNYGKIHNF